MDGSTSSDTVRFPDETLWISSQSEHREHGCP